MSNKYLVGGIGKTQLALEFARKFSNYSFNFWLDVGSSLKTTPASLRSELKSLRHEVKFSLRDVQRYLSLGCIGLWGILQDDLGMKIEGDAYYLMRLWQDLYLFLIRLQQLLLKLEKILRFWEKALYLLLLSSFSEFPCSFRPPCTTMPWTIWPALVVLWGVCWMFYEPFSFDWDAGQFDHENSSSQFLGNY